jgi:hypothetical protein
MNFPTDKSSMNLIKGGMLFLNLMFIIGLTMYLLNDEDFFHLDLNRMPIISSFIGMLVGNISVFRRIKSAEKQNKNT